MKWSYANNVFDQFVICTHLGLVGSGLKGMDSDNLLEPVEGDDRERVGDLVGWNVVDHEPVQAQRLPVDDVPPRRPEPWLSDPGPDDGAGVGQRPARRRPPVWDARFLFELTEADQ